MKQYAVEAGLLERDMPPANHPLFENDADVQNLGDLIDARTEGGATDAKPGEKLSEGSNGKTAFDDVDDEDSYSTRADFADSMLSTDPDSDAGEEFLTGAGLDRSPDMTGTVEGLMRGTNTHLPQDVGADGFRIVEPEDVGDLRADPLDDTDYNRTQTLRGLEKSDPMNAELVDDEDDTDGHRIPITETGKVMSAEDTLDATRRLT